MARASDQFRSSDVTFWGLAALVCCGLAVLAAFVAGLLRHGAMLDTGSTRAQEAIVSELRAQIATLTAGSEQLRRENATLVVRLAAAEAAASGVAQRVQVVEQTLPGLIQRQGEIDARIETGSIGKAPPQRAAPATSLFGAGAEQALPPPAVQWGVAVGRPVSDADASAEWSRVTLRAGAMLLGFRPLLASADAGAGRVVAGPVADETRALALCNEMARADIACMPTEYAGTPLR